MKYRFIVNPAAGKGKIAAELAEKIEKVCREQNLDYVVYFTTGIGDATDYVLREGAARGDEPIRFYACGGDGTLGETVTGIMGLADTSGVELGLFPIGTGNDFVRNFEPRETFFDVEAQIAAASTEIDLIRCNEHYAINMVNIGFDCEVVCKTVNLKRHPLIPSKLAYIAGLVITLVKKPGVHMSLSCDGGEAQDKQFLLTTFANGCFCGGGFHSNPAASLSDGKIDALFVNNVTRRTFVSMVGAYKKGTHLAPKYQHILKNEKHEHVLMKFSQLVNVSVDGEILRAKEVHLSILPRALRFLLPLGTVARKKAVQA